MSYKNLKLSPWTHPTTGAIRIYINTEYVEYRAGMGAANGCWITADENGAPQFGFKPSYNGEDRAIALYEVARLIADKPGLAEKDGLALKIGLSFADLLERIEASKTPKGHFSFIRYEKQYHNNSDMRYIKKTMEMGRN